MTCVCSHDKSVICGYHALLYYFYERDEVDSK